MLINFTELMEMAGDNLELVNKLAEIEKNVIKEELYNKLYSTNAILNDADFKKNRTLVAANSYHINELKDLVLFYGYDKVNSVLLEMLDAKSIVEDY